MLDDEVRIRHAEVEESEILTDLAWRSKEYWDYDAAEMSSFREMLKITPHMIESGLACLAENEEKEEILGFYCMENMSEGKCWLKHIYVVPEHIGSGLGSELFLNACELAETIGVDELWILSNRYSEEFFCHMGAEPVGEKVIANNGTQNKFTVLKITLTTEA